jgi:hypothetical protein
MAYDSYYNRDSKKISSIDDDFAAYTIQKPRNNEPFARNYAKAEQGGLDPSYGRKYPLNDDQEINQFRKPVNNNKRYPNESMQEASFYRKPSSVANSNPPEQEYNRYGAREQEFNRYGAREQEYNRYEFRDKEPDRNDSKPENSFAKKAEEAQTFRSKADQVSNFMKDGIFILNFFLLTITEKKLQI